MENLYENFLKVSLKESADDVRETLERLGIGINSTKILKQSCHLIRIEDNWYIVHYKELFYLTKGKANWFEGDLERRNKIAENDGYLWDICVAERETCEWLARLCWPYDDVIMVISIETVCP